MKIDLSNINLEGRARQRELDDQLSRLAQAIADRIPTDSWDFMETSGLHNLMRKLRIRLTDRIHNEVTALWVIVAVQMAAIVLLILLK